MVSSSKRSRIKFILDRSTKTRGRHFVSFVWLGEADPKDLGFRVGVLASKKVVDKRAVVRNRARRRIRAAIQLAVGEKSAIDGHWIVMANRSALKCPFKELVEEARMSYQRMSLLSLKREGDKT